MRPILFEVDVAVTPPQMTLLFPGRPHRTVTVRIRHAVVGRDDAYRAAVAELVALSTEEFAPLRACSKPLPAAEDFASV
ncbi:MAG TPA: hypothetical protein VGM50_13645 [Gemmatimonadaceae bacterium]